MYFYGYVADVGRLSVKFAKQIIQEFEDFIRISWEEMKRMPLFQLMEEKLREVVRALVLPFFIFFGLFNLLLLHFLLSLYDTAALINGHLLVDFLQVQKLNNYRFNAFIRFVFYTLNKLQSK